MEENLKVNVKKFLNGEITVKDLLSIEDEEIDYLLQLGYIFFKEGRLDESEKIFRSLIEIVPENGYPYFGLGAIYLRKEDFDKAIEFFKRGLERDPENVSGLLNMGEALLLKGNREYAHKYLLKCKQLVTLEDYPVYTRVRMLLTTFFKE